MKLRNITLAAALVLILTGCKESGPSSNGGAGQNPQYPKPAPRREESVISRLSSNQIESVHGCVKSFWEVAREEWPQIGGAYLITCLTKFERITNSDWTPQFEKDFTVLLLKLNKEFANEPVNDRNSFDRSPGT